MSPRLPRGPARPKLQTPDDEMTLTEHLGELRVRIIRSALAVALFAILVVAFYDQVLDLLRAPYDRLCESKPEDFCGVTVGPDGRPTLFNFDPIEGFATRLRIGSYGGLILAMPVVLWQVWRFIVPALHAKEKRYAIPFICSSVLLFLLGGLLAFLTLEKALEFLISWSGEDVSQAFQVSKYVRLVMLMIAAFGVGLQFPVLLVFLQLVGIVTPQQLISQWRYAIIGIVVVAAVITPSGDPISLAALAIPMTVLYVVSVVIGKFVQRRRRRKEAMAT
ncbi:MAG: twin-arginine translocase subunit TatC [Actinomycetota bacterium]|nr:twin-arginine translocase subunit TatC [Actinomycetota bacterium]